MKSLIVLASSLGMAISTAHAAPVNNAKAAELNLHRIERLVILKKIEASYQTNYRAMIVQKLTVQNPGDPSYKVTSAEVPGANGTAKTLDVLLDENGKEVSHQAYEGADSVGVPVWPNQDAITLAENSLHWLEDQGPVVAALKPYNDSMTRLDLIPGSNPTGKPVGVVDIQTTAAEPILRIYMTLEGTFDSYQLVPR